jgi:hypothetical protein
MTESNASNPSLDIAVEYPDAAKAVEDQTPLVTLAMLVWGEARGEAQPTRLAVAHTVANRRARRPRYGADWQNICLAPYQYDCFLPSDLNRTKLLFPVHFGTLETWQSCYQAAYLVFHALEIDATEQATHYFDDSLLPNHAPYWIHSQTFTHTVSLGRLHFYREGSLLGLAHEP